MPEPLPEFDPFQKRLRLVTEAPPRASAGDVPASSAMPSASVTVPPVIAGEAPRFVTDTAPGPVTDPSVSSVSDGDGDTDTGLPEFEEFGRKMPRGKSAAIAVRGSTGGFAKTAAKGLVSLKAWSAGPQSIREHIDTVWDESWIPEGHESAGSMVFLRALRVSYGMTLGLLFVAAGNFLAWLGVPQHLIGFLIFTGLLYLITLH